MALQSSGAISLSQVQAEFTGVNPISMSEYYRNGPYVPGTIDTTLYEPGPGSTNFAVSFTVPLYYWANYSVGFGYDDGSAGVWWNNVKVTSGPLYPPTTSLTVGAYTYYRGVQQGSSFVGTSSGFNVYRDTYTVRRQSGSSQSVNQSIPVSGTISMSNFYGGRKT